MHNGTAGKQNMNIKQLRERRIQKHDLMQLRRSIRTISIRRTTLSGPGDDTHSTLKAFPLLLAELEF